LPKWKKNSRLGCVAHHIAMEVVGNVPRNWCHADNTVTICRDLDLSLIVTDLQRLALQIIVVVAHLQAVGHTHHWCFVDVEVVTVTDLVTVNVVDSIDVSHVTVQVSPDAWSHKVDARARNLEEVVVAAIPPDLRNQFK